MAAKIKIMMNNEDTRQCLKLKNQRCSVVLPITALVRHKNARKYFFQFYSSILFLRNIEK